MKEKNVSCSRLQDSRSVKRKTREQENKTPPPPFLRFTPSYICTHCKGDYLENSTQDPGITIVVSQLTEMAGLSYDRKVDFCCV